jgi:hypothetical protein
VTNPTKAVTDPRMLAGVDMIGRTGATDIRIGFSDPDDGDPVIWYVVATWERVGKKISEAAAALDPLNALMRLCEVVIDGGHCTHCGKMTSFVLDTDTALLDMFSCVYSWDPELGTFRRQCEGDTDE